MEQKAANTIQDKIMGISDAFYQNEIGIGTEQLPEVIKDLTAIVPQLLPEQQSAYMTVLKNMMEAMEMKDYIMLADIMTFDITELLEQYGVE